MGARVSEPPTYPTRHEPFSNQTGTDLQTIHRRIHDSLTLIFRLTGRTRRTPHEYRAIDSLTYKSQERLVNTHECVHASVRIRMGLKGYGYDDKGLYDSDGLVGWIMEGTEASSSPSSSPSSSSSSSSSSYQGTEKEKGSEVAVTDIKWVKRDLQQRRSNNIPNPDLIMPEDPLGDLEREVMKSWPNVERGFALIRPGARPLKMHKSSTDPVRRERRNSRVSNVGVSGPDNMDGRHQESTSEEGRNGKGIVIEEVERAGDVGMKKSPTMKTM